MEDLRFALRKLAKAVVVVTARSGGVRFAMSATAVSEVSFDPPTMLVCVNRNATIHDAMRASDSFCLNILGSRQENISRNCGGGRKGEERFAEGDWIDMPSGVPRLATAEASMECRTVDCFSVGTHDIFIGEVIAVHAGDGTDPLVYMDGRYGRFLSSAA